MYSNMKFTYLTNMLFTIEGILGRMMVQYGSFLVSVAIF
jgi:hypothetical protein